MVSSEEIGKQLLQHGRLKRRFTIIPLNKIVARKIANDVVKRAQQLVSKVVVHSLHIHVFILGRS